MTSAFLFFTHHVTRMLAYVFVFFVICTLSLAAYLKLSDARITYSNTPSLKARLFYVTPYEATEIKRGTLVILCPDDSKRDMINTVFDAYRDMPIPSDCQQAMLVKRVVGLPNEKITIHHGVVTVSDHTIGAMPMYMDSSTGDWIRPYGDLGYSQTPTELALNNDELFFLGDHNLSLDSRYLGTFNEDEIVGIAHPIF